MDSLICPVCRSHGVETPLHREGNSLFCGAGHCFDISKTGSVTFTTPSGDDSDMVKARTGFLESGAYDAFAMTLAAEIPGRPGLIVDAGCGEGYYTNRFARAVGTDAENPKRTEVWGFDLSKAAITHASKAAASTHSGAFFAVAGIFELPVASESADVVFSIFAPISDEFSRILKPGGLLVVGAAGKRHLYELKSAIYDEVYENEGRRDLAALSESGMELLRCEKVTYGFTCRGENIKRLFSMTPYYYKTSKEDAAKLDPIDSLDITADFDIFVYRKRA